MDSAKTHTHPQPLAGATPMQLRQHQVDVWQNRHNFHHVMTPGTRAAATDRAIEADHAEALEMNANDDSGRVACLGPEPANGQTIAERKIDVDRLEAVLQGMIIMLRENPDIPVPWSVDISCKTTEPAFNRFLERHDIKTLSSGEWMAYLAPLAERYSCAEDRAGFYMPWSIAIQPEDRPL